MSKKRGGLALLLGTAIGFIVGLLTAPKSGKETRQDIKDKASETAAQLDDKLKEVYKSLTKSLKDLEKQAKKVSGKSKKELNSLQKRAVEIKKTIKIALSDLHDGLTDNDDIEKVFREVETIKRKIERLIK